MTILEICSAGINKQLLNKIEWERERIRMKKLVIEDKNEGLRKLLGEVITVYCLSFIYSGKLTGVNDDCILLEGARIVYDTGAHDIKTWADSSAMPGDWYVMKNAIESFGIFKEA